MPAPAHAPPAPAPATAPPPDARAPLLRLLENQRAAFARRAPDHARRIWALATLRDAILAHRDELVTAVSDDFGGRSREETLLLEIFPLVDQIRHARRHLRSWMKRRRVPSTWFLLPSRAFYEYQPLGVVGVIGAWNYQILMTLGPMVDALAAGNHVIVKPSEITPRSAEVLARLVAGAFPADYVTCVTGGVEVATAFASLPFDHLFFTGSGRVGRLVMESASRNLVPVTLELGGKSPAIVHESYPLARAAERIMAGKFWNAGQTCVAPDYVLLPEGREEAFTEAARRATAAMYPRLVGNPDWTRIVSDRHHARLLALLDEAGARGARVVTLAPDAAPAAGDRVIPPTLVFGAGDDTALMREEIFGPLLPVVTYRTLDEALARVNAGARPLALYYFNDDRGRVDDVLRRTMSGGVLVNDCVLHLGQHHLPFGGVGASGMGHYHGFDGFVTMSKKRGVMVQSRWTLTGRFRAPFTERSRRLIALLLRIAGR